MPTCSALASTTDEQDYDQDQLLEADRTSLII
jgi:hypothetical protein